MAVERQCIKWDQFSSKQFIMNNGSNIKIDARSSFSYCMISSSSVWNKGIHRFTIQCIDPSKCRIGIENDQNNLFAYWSNGYAIKMGNFEIPTKTLNINNNAYKSTSTWVYNHSTLFPTKSTNTSTLSWNKYDFIGVELNCSDPKHPKVTFFKNNIAVTDPINIIKYNTYHLAIQILKSPCHYDLNPFTYTTTYHIGETIEFFDDVSTNWYRGTILNENYKTGEYNIGYGHNQSQTISRHKYSKQIAKLYTHLPQLKKNPMPIAVRSHATYIHLTKRNESYMVFKATNGRVYMYNINLKTYNVINTTKVEHIAFNGKKYLFLLTSTKCFVFDVYKKVTKKTFNLPQSKFSVNSCFIPYPFNGIYRIASTGLHYKIDVKKGKYICLGTLKKANVKRWKLVYNHGKRMLYLFYFDSSDKKCVYGIDIKQINNITINSLNSYNLNNKCLRKMVNKLAKEMDVHKKVYMCNMLDNICAIGYEKYKIIQQIHCYDFVTDNIYSVEKNMERSVEDLMTTSNGYLLMFDKHGDQYQADLMNIIPSKVVELQRKRLKLLISVYLKFIKQKDRNVIIPTELEQMIFLFYPWFI